MHNWLPKKYLDELFKLKSYSCYALRFSKNCSLKKNRNLRSVDFHLNPGSFQRSPSKKGGHFVFRVNYNAVFIAVFPI